MVVGRGGQVLFGKTHRTAAVVEIVQAAVLQWVMVADDRSGVVRRGWKKSGVLVRVRVWRMELGSI